MIKKKLIWIFVFIFTALTFPFWAYESFLWITHGFSKDYNKIDKCIDSGGKWDYANRTCLYADTIMNSKIKLPDGWILPKDTLFSNKWINMDHEKYLKFADDFDGNGLMDSVFILETLNGNDFGIFVFKYYKDSIKCEEIYNTMKDIELKKAMLEHPGYNTIKMYKLVYGIRTVIPGKHLTACGKGYWECDENETEEIELKNAGIDFFHYDAGGARYFYYVNDKKEWQYAWIDD